MNKILFIYEGQNTEKKFCKMIIEQYFLKDGKEKEYMAYCANIYSLYDEMIKNYGLDIVELLAERAKLADKTNDYEKLKAGGFSEIFLIFDFDPHSPTYDEHKIKSMVKYFDNETENGKLYINYPMMESIKHFTSIPDENYRNYKININDCKYYKEYVNKISCINHFNDIDEETLYIIISQNLDKYEYISKYKIDTYIKYLNKYSQLKLLNIQLNNILSNNCFFVFNSSVFWGLDYYGEKLYMKHYQYNKQHDFS